MYEVWQYDTITKYDPSTGDGGLFAQYMNTFMKIKMEASGYLFQCNTDVVQSMRDVVQSLNIASIIYGENFPNPR